MPKKQKIITRQKAKKILKEGKAHGKRITKKQKGFFGARAGGAPIKMKRRKA